MEVMKASRSFLFRVSTSFFRKVFFNMSMIDRCDGEC